MRRLLFVALLIGAVSTMASAQFYMGPHIGFKAFGLEGILQNKSPDANNQIQTARSSNDARASKTTVDFGINLGYQIVKTSYYGFDLGLDTRLAWANFMEEAYNDVVGSGEYSARGFKGGKTMVLGVDLMPVNRMTFPKLYLLSPYLAVGPSVNIYRTGGIDEPQGNNQPVLKLSGKTSAKIGLHVTWGLDLRPTPHVWPYLQFKHMLGFGSEFNFSEDRRSAWLIEDAPGMWGMTGGVRFVF